jgi:Zn-dependent protease
MTVALRTADAFPSTCEDCRTEVSEQVLVCPRCHRLVHARTLAALRDEARAAAARGDRHAELQAWQSAIRLVPATSRQHAMLTAKIESLETPSETTPEAPADPPATGPWRWLSGLGALGAIIWKLKFLLVALLGKGKLLLLGLTKAGTLLSMLLAFGVYWTAWGMWFALGLVLSIYVHEMGHVAALRRFGLAATAPMFVPGLGAFIRLRGRQLPAYQNARVGLAGPLWGLAAAAAALMIGRFGGGPMWTAIAHTGAWLNLFNLIPVWQLDGNRGFSALTRTHRVIVTLAFGAAWIATGDGLIVLLLIVSAARAFDAQAPAAEDRGALLQFVGLVLALAAVFRAASDVTGQPF